MDEGFQAISVFGLVIALILITGGVYTIVCVRIPRKKEFPFELVQTEVQGYALIDNLIMHGSYWYCLKGQWVKVWYKGKTEADKYIFQPSEHLAFYLQREEVEALIYTREDPHEPVEPTCLKS